MINVIIPMCGVSKRFTDADYTVPKYVLDVDGVPMYAAAVNCLNLTVEHQLIFVVNSLISAEYNLKNNIRLHFPDAHIIELVNPTQGMAETVMKTRQHLDYQDRGSLVLCCDQLIEYDSVAYNQMLDNPHIAGSLLTFHDESRDPKWTYARIDLIEQINNYQLILLNELYLLNFLNIQLQFLHYHYLAKLDTHYHLVLLV